MEELRVMNGLTVEDGMTTIQTEFILQFFFPLRAVRVLQKNQSASYDKIEWR